MYGFFLLSLLDISLTKYLASIMLFETTKLSELFLTTNLVSIQRHCGVDGIVIAIPKSVGQILLTLLCNCVF